MPSNLQHLLNLVHGDNPGFDADAVDAFIARWKDSGGAESRYSQTFFSELFDLLGLDFDITDNATTDRCVVFEAPVVIPGESNPKKMDVYRPAQWVIEAKQGSFAHHDSRGHGRRGTKAYLDAMEAAFHQAHRYAVNASEGAPPVLMVVDVGFRFDIWTAYSGGFGGYGARGSFKLEELRDPEVYSLLYDLLDDPQRRNPERVAAHITRDVAGRLAVLAKDLEESGHDPEKIAQFLMRCLFTMFAEDIDLLEGKLFEKYLKERWLPHPERFKSEIEMLWETMDEGGELPFVGSIHRFNGALFRDAEALELSHDQIEKLHEAACADWTNVEPSIFGTLLERALNPKERHRLGAHYTPRAYIERLVRPTIEEPLRDKWNLVEVRVKELTATDNDQEPKPKDVDKAIEEILAFKKELSSVRVLDPACGSGNFLYVTFDLLKRIETEVDARLAELGHTQQALGMGDFSVTPAQFFGIEIKPWAKEIAELVIWIGYLQWWRRRHPNSLPAEPILRDHHNIECRDAVLDYDEKIPLVNDGGEPVDVWDGETMKVHSVTGDEVPDESARRVVYEYVNPRKAKAWPEAEFIVGNPPYLGARHIRDALGDGYLEALRQFHGDVPDHVDYVMYWWEHAAKLVKSGNASRFGFITTKSITQSFSRPLVTRALVESPELSVTFAIPNHPWVDSRSGAQVRVAMTVCEAGVNEGRLLQVTSEQTVGDEAPDVEFDVQTGTVNPDLTVGANVTAAHKLTANDGITSVGYQLTGKGFVLPKADREELLSRGNQETGDYIHPLFNGRDLVQEGRGLFAIDVSELSEEQLHSEQPVLYQWLHDRVKPVRDQNRRKSVRENWWVYGEARNTFRPALKQLSRAIVTPLTSKHRMFFFCRPQDICDSSTVMFAFDDAFFLGVLSSRLHVDWASRSGSRMGVGNDPRYTKTRCFDPFPFPAATEDQKHEIRELAEELDALRKRQQEKHAKLTITDMYNVLEKLRDDEALDEKERKINEQGLVSSHLLPLHDKLDRAVAEAYGWEADLEDEEILQRLVDLNRERAEEEARGVVRWLRPEFQNPDGVEDEAVQEEIAAVVEQEDDEEEVVVVDELRWPKDEMKRIEELRNLIKEKPGLETEGLQKHFTKGWRKKRRYREIGETLEAMEKAGMIVQVDGGRWF